MSNTNNSFNDIILNDNVRPVFKSERLLIKYIYPHIKNFDDYKYKHKDRGLFYSKNDNIHIPIKELTNLLSDPIKCKDLREEGFEALNFDDSLSFKEELDSYSFRLQNLFFEAEQFINYDLPAKYDVKKATEIVSFSGGKDSTVVSHLVRRIKGNNNLLHVFGDTTLEDPNTYKYILRFQEANSTTPFIYTENDKDFFELCKKIGPPSRVMRWCCPIFKTGPIDEEFNLLTVSGNKKKVITYIGIRKSESTRRSKYNLIEESPKIKGQVAVHPIFNWTELDIYFYLLKNRLDFNDSYKLGFNRVGCWCCPMNSSWSDGLYRIYFPESANKWRNYLLNFAENAGKTNILDYVDNKMWAKRQGGDGLKNAFSGLDFRMCGDLENSMRYIPTVEITDKLMEFLKPLGYFDLNKWEDVDKLYIEKPKGFVRFIIEVDKDRKSLKITSTETNGNKLRSELSEFKSQLVKYDNCIQCGACFQTCQFDAISFQNSCYVIDNVKCKKCGKCISAFDSGCLVAKVTKVKKKV